MFAPKMFSLRTCLVAGSRHILTVFDLHHYPDRLLILEEALPASEITGGGGEGVRTGP